MKKIILTGLICLINYIDSSGQEAPDRHNRLDQMCAKFDKEWEESRKTAEAVIKPFVEQVDTNKFTVPLSHRDYFQRILDLTMKDFDFTVTDFYWANHGVNVSFKTREIELTQEDFLCILKAIFSLIGFKNELHESNFEFKCRISDYVARADFTFRNGSYSESYNVLLSDLYPSKYSYIIRIPPGAHLLSPFWVHSHCSCDQWLYNLYQRAAILPGSDYNMYSTSRRLAQAQGHRARSCHLSRL